MKTLALTLALAALAVPAMAEHHEGATHDAVKQEVAKHETKAKAHADAAKHSAKAAKEEAKAAAATAEAAATESHEGHEEHGSH